MWACFKECVKSVLPSAGVITVALIVAGLIALGLSGPLGWAALTAGSVAAIVGTSVASTAIGTLLGCLRNCL
jgi:uncharacterized BrkB/YihY/UPF0761 family membrane protein